MEAPNCLTRWTFTHHLPEIRASTDHCGKLAVTWDRDVPPYSTLAEPEKASALAV